MAVDPVELRHAMANLAGSVNVVCCRAYDQDHAMTATAVASVSLDPPLVLFCVAHTSRFWEAVSATDQWTISILADTGRPDAEWLATKGRPLERQLDRVQHQRTEQGIAVLSESLTWLECRTFSQTTAGDHDIVVGEVDRAVVNAGEQPLVYWRARYTSLSEPGSVSAGNQ